MVAGYGGSYRATVVDGADPAQHYRLQVLVPDIFGTEPVWAVAALPLDTARPLPTVGDAVSISFEHGDTDYPVWEHPTTEQPGPTQGYPGKYHGTVTSIDDPLYQRRLQVTVPEVDATPTWATPAGQAAESEDLPPIGSAVWIEYEHGDPTQPRWVAVSI
jgi:Type VI secretion system/phage-baseplate injector OB domain